MRSEVAGRVDQRVDVEAGAAAHEEHRDQEAVADRLDLAPELDVGQVLVRVDDPQQRAGDERAEDRLEPELGREHDEAARAAAIATRTPSWADVSSSASERLRDPQRPARLQHRDADDDDEQRRTRPAGTTFDPEPVEPDELVEKKREMSRIVPNSASDAAASTVWPNVVSTSPASRMTGTMSPSDVDANMIATKSGLRIDSTGWSTNAHADRERERRDERRARWCPSGRAAGPGRSRARRGRAGTRARRVTAR